MIAGFEALSKGKSFGLRCKRRAEVILIGICFLTLALEKPCVAGENKHPENNENSNIAGKPADWRRHFHHCGCLCGGV